MGFQVKFGDATHAIDAPASGTVLELKQAIEKQLKVPASGQKLTVGGKIMKNDKSLSDYPAASTQAVMLMASGGAPAAAASGKSDERKQIDSLVTDIIGMIQENKEVQAWREKNEGDLPDTSDLQAALGVDGVESAKQKVLDELTQVLDGNWEAFDQYHGPLREYAYKMLGRRDVTTEQRDEWVEKAATMALSKLSEFPEVQDNIKKESKAGRDMVSELVPVAKVLARRAIDLFLDGPNARFAEHPKFHQQVRLLVVTVVGSLMDGVIDVLEHGKPQCQQLMATVTGKIIEKLAKKMPDYSTLFAFAGPMAMNQLLAWHDEYTTSIKGKTYP